jgi:hypothetical protein
MEEQPTRTKHQIKGRIRDDNQFLLKVTTPVTAAFNRTTKMRAAIERNKGMTIIEGSVSAGVPQDRISVVIGSVLMVAIMMLLLGNFFISFGIALIGFALYIPLVGDYNNRTILMKELKKVTKASERPIKK